MSEERSGNLGGERKGKGVGASLGEEVGVVGKGVDVVGQAHSFTVLSRDPLASIVPSLENATEYTSLVCPVRVRRRAPLLGLHSFTVLSSDPLASIVPSLENATDREELVFPVRVLSLIESTLHVSKAASQESAPQVGEEVGLSEEPLPARTTWNEAAQTVYRARLAMLAICAWAEARRISDHTIPLDGSIGLL